MCAWLESALDPHLGPGPQVVKDFVSEVDTAMLCDGESGAEQERQRRRKRQRSWLDRDGKDDCAGWRVEKRPRQAA